MTTLKSVAAGAMVLYAAVCVLFWADPPFLGTGAAELPRWTVLLAMTVVGPALFLPWSWKLFVASLLVITACLTFARFAWRTWPESEVFALGLLGAAGLWASSGWVIVVLAW